MYLAKEMAKDWKPFSYEDFVRMLRYHMIVRMIIDGQPCNPFTAISIEHLKEL